MNQSGNGSNGVGILMRENLSGQPISINWLNEIIIPAINLFYNPSAGTDSIPLNMPETDITAKIRSNMELYLHALQPRRLLAEDIVIDSDCELEKIATDACNSCFEMGCLIKMTAYGVSAIIPDILIHRRGSDESNKVAIEFKKAENDSPNERAHDRAKLTYLTCHNSRYKYDNGYFIDLYEGGYAITNTLAKNTTIYPVHISG